METKTIPQATATVVPALLASMPQHMPETEPSPTLPSASRGPSPPVLSGSNE
jgi:hypothetical protein